MIYEYITSRGGLGEPQRIELKTKRGFTDETIAKHRFFNGGKYLLSIESDLINNFSKEDLINSGTFLEDEKGFHMSPMLLQNNIIIPYLNKEGKAYHLRPHKLGFKGLATEVFHEQSVAKSVILTEGEFKAVAANQLGLPAIAIPGISSFSEANFPRLLKFLNTHAVKEIIIIFDNETKDNPELPNYKDNPMVRWDTQFYAYYMAKLLDKEGLNCLIATLPQGWMQNGKIDIDGAVAQGKTYEDLKNVIIKSKKHHEYLDEISPEAKKIIIKKTAKKYFKSHIHKDFNKYVATRRRGKTEWDEVISNFTIQIVATHETMEGVMREVVFVNEFNEHTQSITITPESMAGADSFATFCLANGNFIWKGTKEDLHNIWENEFLNDDGRHITEPDHIGWLPRENMWLFGNVAFKEGKEMRADSNHIFWTEKRGIKPIPLGISSGRQMISEGIPFLHVNDFDYMMLKDKLCRSIGQNEAKICLGWITSVVFMEDVFNLYGCFPFLFIKGKRASGKSTVAEWLMNFFGLENAGKMASDTTAVAMQRYLGYYSSLPVFIDEYRNSKQITQKNGFLRNAYNRQSAGKGMKSEFGIREAKIRGTLILAGEEMPSDNALQTRCIGVNITEKNRIENHYKWFMANRIKFSNYILNILRRKPQLIDKYLTELNAAKDFFTKRDCDDRTAINYAIVGAGYGTAFGEDDEFNLWLADESLRTKISNEEEQAVSVFLEDMMGYKELGKFKEMSLWSCDENFIYLYFKGLYLIWSQEFRKSNAVEPFKMAAIRDYLKEEPGFIEADKVIRIGHSSKRCMVFDRSKASIYLKELVEEC